MDTVDRLRDLVLAATWLAYRRTGSCREAARLLGLPVSRADVHGWLVRCIEPSDEVVHETYPAARELLQSEIDAVGRRVDEFLQPADAITLRSARSEGAEEA